MSGLANALNIMDQKDAIFKTCTRDPDPATCELREVLNRFIDTQPPESCKETVMKIVIALESFGDRYVKKSNELKRMFSLGDILNYIHTVSL